MRHALCAMLYGNDAVLGGRMCVEPHGQARCSILKPCVGLHPPLNSGQADQELVGFCCRGKLWLQGRTPEQLKGEGG